MKKRILTLLLCMCMLLCIPRASASVTLLGDVDCDGEITVADASLLLRYLVRLADGISEQGLENADANSDGVLDAEDASLILRHLVKLIDLASLTPEPTATASPSPTPTPSGELDQELLKQITLGCRIGSNEWHDWTEYAEDITRFIQSMPTSDPYRQILYQGATHMGTAYATMDCSGFVRTVYREDCGYKKEYPSGGSDTVIQWFLTNQKDRIHNAIVDEFGIDTTGWKPGYVLGYVDAKGRGNHVSIYLGCVDGVHFVMESSTSRGGVCIRRVWTNDTWHLKYYINPLD